MLDSIEKHSYVKHDAANNVLLVCIINQDNSFRCTPFKRAFDLLTVESTPVSFK